MQVEKSMMHAETILNSSKASNKNYDRYKLDRKRLQ